MQKLLLKRTLRDLKANTFRYLALFLLIALSMFLVISIVGSAQSVIGTVDKKAEANRLENGQFGAFIPLGQTAQNEIEALGFTLQESFYLDFQMEDGSTLRIMKNRELMNLIEPESGRIAADCGEILLERIYADAHKLIPGDAITIAGLNFSICGTGTTPDYDNCLQNMNDMSSDGRNFGTAFVTPDAYEALKKTGNALHSEEYRYSYRMKETAKNAGEISDYGLDSASASDDRLKEYLQNRTIRPDEVQDAYFQEMAYPKTAERTSVTDLELVNLTDFVRAEDNPRIKAASSDVELNIKVGLLAGFMVLVLITYVISVFLIHSIDQESAMIGALYALGLKRKQLMFHYTMLPVLLCLMGGAAGTLAGYSKPGISLMSGETRSYFSIPAPETVYSPWLLIYGFVLPPLTAFLVNKIIIRRRLSRSALSLLRREVTWSKFRPKSRAEGRSVTRLKSWAEVRSVCRLKSRVEVRLNLRAGFIRTFQIRQFLRERRSCLAVLAGMFVSLLILTLGLNCYALCFNIRKDTKADIRYSYLYQYKYPGGEIPEGGYEAYIEGLKQEIRGYEMEVTLIGLTEENPFFPAIRSERTNELSISSSVAQKYGLTAGDTFVLRDAVNETAYRFTVKEIVPYSAGLCCFMDLSSMRSLFDRKADYYNAVYSDRPLDIDAGRLYAVSTKEAVNKSTDIFMELMLPLIVVMTAASSIIFLIVLYQMMKVMIDRSAASISLMKIFGYRNREIRKLYLDGNFLLIAAGALILIPAAKFLMDRIYPSLIANIACGLNLSWPPALGLAVYAGILLSYLFIRTALMGRLKKLSPAAVLKDRE